MKDIKLHLGCGKTRLDGFVNIDAVPGCDLQLDLNREVLPYADGSVECIFAYHTIEHLEDYLFALYEIWRVLRHGGRFLMGVPYVTLTEFNLVNPFHKRNFNEFSFDFFEHGKLKGCANETNPILFTKAWHRFNYLSEFELLPDTVREFSRRHLFNVVRSIDFGVYAVKPPCSKIEILETSAKELEAEFDRCLNLRRRNP
jgi:SAM-dependent methyltransferase